MRHLSCLAGLLLAACGPSVAGDADDEPDPGQLTDADGDGIPAEAGDCDDSNDDVYPGAPEFEDGLDNDCDGRIDDDLPDVDDDGDGYSNIEGDCDDSEPLINPGSVEVDIRLDDDGNEIAEGVDNDCDGLIDEGLDTCDDALTGGPADDYAQAIELCGEWLVDARFSSGVPLSQRAIRASFGTYTPHAGAAMAALSTGRTVARGEPGWSNPSPGTGTGGASLPHPSPQGDPDDGCGAADPPYVEDYVALTLTIRVPTNAESLAYDFNFMSAEFPRYVCSDYDDTFLAVLDSAEYDGNISFDANGRPVTINVGFFDVCSPLQGPTCTGNSELQGTGFEQYGGTGWLHTIAPVTPGETITLTFHIFDEGDDIWDSIVLLDNFQWLGIPVDGPITVERNAADEVRRALEAGATVEELRAIY